MNVLDLFSGIGGFSLGLERAGMRTVAFCEIEPFCRAVLRKHWPGVPIFEDVRTLTAADVPRVDVICGGFPCQPFSIGASSKRMGREDNRYLWPEYSRLVKELRPAWVVGENVIGIVDMALDDVLADLEGLGYSTRTFDIPACAVGADHERRRTWIVANADSERFQGGVERLQENQGEGDFYAAVLAPLALWPQRRNDIPKPWICRGHDGIPNRAHRIKSLGNAVVPQIPEIIGRAIMQAERIAA